MPNYDWYISLLIFFCVFCRRFRVTKIQNRFRGTIFRIRIQEEKNCNYIIIVSEGQSQLKNCEQYQQIE